MPGLPGLEIITTSDRPDLVPQSEAALLPVWPEFIFHDQVSEELTGAGGGLVPALHRRGNRSGQAQRAAGGRRS